jgi:hypothetical protein
MQINQKQQRSTQNYGQKKLKFQHKDYQNHGYINKILSLTHSKHQGINKKFFEQINTVIRLSS